MCGCGCNNFRNVQGVFASNDNSNLANQSLNQPISLNNFNSTNSNLNNSSSNNSNLNNSSSNDCCNCSTISSNNCSNCSTMGQNNSNSNNYGNYSITDSNNSEFNNCGCQNSPRCGTNLSNDNWNCLLQNYIGRRCSCEFQLANNLVKRTGILNNVGTNFLVLASSNNCSNILLCDTSSLVFVKVE